VNVTPSTISTVAATTATATVPPKSPEVKKKPEPVAEPEPEPEPEAEAESASSDSEESRSSVSGNGAKIATVVAPPALYSVATLLEREPEEPESGRRFLGFPASPRVPSGADRFDSKHTAASEALAKSPNISKPPPIPAGIANKEFRKSALNVDLEEQQVAEFRKRQEEIREAQRRAKRFAKKSAKGSSSIHPSIHPLVSDSTEQNVVC